MVLDRGDQESERRQSEAANTGLGRERRTPNASDRVLPKGASLSPSIVSGVVAMADCAAMFGSGLAIYLVYYFAYLGWDGETLPRYLSFLALNTGLALTAFSFAHLYDFESLAHPARQVWKIVGACAFAFMMVAALAFALKISAQFSRVWAFSWFFAATALISLERAGCHVLLRRWGQAGRLTRNVVIVGAGEQGRKLVGLLKGNGHPWLRILGLFDDRLARAPASIDDVEMLGNVDHLVRFAQANRVDDILVALPWAAEQRLLGILHKVKVLPAHVQLSPDMIGLNLLRHDFERLGGIPFLKVSAKPLSGWNLVLKAFEDRVLGALILLFILPLMLVIAAAIKLDDRGPVLFRQKRYGFNNQHIEVWKFRTMYHDPDPNPSTPQATRDDSRVTRVGAFLRRASLDELPQFVNVFQGNMSIVGPRPHAVAHNEHYAKLIDSYLSRHRVKPGITGWAQVNGWRGETDTIEKMEGRVEHDLDYIENWSIIKDIQIILWTMWIVLRGENAY